MMKKFWNQTCQELYNKGSKDLNRYLNNERGEGLLGALGWGVVIVTAIVLVHGLITGWLPTFVTEKIFNRMNEL